jgi:hypothetical protein
MKDEEFPVYVGLIGVVVTGFFICSLTFFGMMKLFWYLHRNDLGWALWIGVPLGPIAIAGVISNAAKLREKLKETSPGTVTRIKECVMGFFYIIGSITLFWLTFRALCGIFGS